jgi:hypothetical protein
MKKGINRLRKKMEEKVRIKINFLPRSIESTEIKRKKESTLAGLKDLIRNNLRNQFPNLDLNEQIKLLIFAKSYPDTTNLIQLLNEENVENDKLEINAIINVEGHRLAKTEAHQAIHNTRILNHNVKQCNEAALNLIQPTDRVRFNEPEFVTPDVPTLFDLALVNEELAESFRTASHAHQRFSDVLHAIESETLNRDANIRENTLIEARKVIQNALDGNRY